MAENKPNACCIFESCTCFQPLLALSMSTVGFITARFYLDTSFCQLKHIETYIVNWCSKCMWKSCSFNVHRKDTDSGHNFRCSVCIFNEWQTIPEFKDGVKKYIFKHQGKTLFW